MHLNGSVPVGGPIAVHCVQYQQNKAGGIITHDAAGNQLLPESLLSSDSIVVSCVHGSVP